MDRSHTIEQHAGPVIVGWIVADRCRQLRGEIGRYHWTEWKQAAQALELRVVIVRCGPVPPASLNQRTITIRGGLDDKTTAYLAFHEIGHHVLHAGTPGDWRRMPGGVHLINKFERQANQFAETFPVWE